MRTQKLAKVGAGASGIQANKQTAAKPISARASSKQLNYKAGNLSILSSSTSLSPEAPEASLSAMP